MSPPNLGTAPFGRTSALGRISSLAERVAAVVQLVLLFIRILFLPDLAADVSPAGASSRPAPQRGPRRAPAALGWNGQRVFRFCLRAADQDTSCGAGASLDGDYGSAGVRKSDWRRDESAI